MTTTWIPTPSNIVSWIVNAPNKYKIQRPLPTAAKNPCILQEVTLYKELYDALTKHESSMEQINSTQTSTGIIEQMCGSGQAYYCIHVIPDTPKITDTATATDTTQSRGDLYFVVSDTKIFLHKATKDAASRFQNASEFLLVSVWLEEKRDLDNILKSLTLFTGPEQLAGFYTAIYRGGERTTTDGKKYYDHYAYTWPMQLGNPHPSVSTVSTASTAQTASTVSSTLAQQSVLQVQQAYSQPQTQTQAQTQTQNSSWILEVIAYMRQVGTTDYVSTISINGLTFNKISETPTLQANHTRGQDLLNNWGDVMTSTRIASDVLHRVKGDTSAEINYMVVVSRNSPEPAIIMTRKATTGGVPGETIFMYKHGLPSRDQVVGEEYKLLQLGTTSTITTTATTTRQTAPDVFLLSASNIGVNAPPTQLQDTNPGPNAVVQNPPDVAQVQGPNQQTVSGQVNKQQQDLVQQVPPQQVKPASAPQYTYAPTSITGSAVTTPDYTTTNNNISQSATCGSDSSCYVWTFSEWESVDLGGSLVFNATRDQMKPGKTVPSVTGQYTLVFVNGGGSGNTRSQAHVTHVRISKGVEGDAYDLVAIRPNSEPGVLETTSNTTTCKAVFKSAGGMFVRCKLQITKPVVVPGVYTEWAIPHIDTGRWVVQETTQDGDLLAAGSNVSMNHGIRGTIPSSVVASYAKSAVYEGDEILHRIDGLSKYIIGPNTGANDLKGGVIDAIVAKERGYEMEGLKTTYPAGKKFDDVYFHINNYDYYKSNPHFRFTPPWFEGAQNPSILCIGDSLTSTDHFCFNDISKASPYSELLKSLLQEVGITASVVDNIGVTGAVIWKRIDDTIDIINSGSSSPIAKPHNWSVNEATKKVSQAYYTLAIIWLGTNDLSYIHNQQLDNAPGGQMTESRIKEDLSLDFERLMRGYPAKHYLLVKVDGARSGNCPIDQNGSIDISTCKRDITGPYIGNKFLEPADTVNDTLLGLEQKYSNVHVADINYGVERCPSEKSGGFLHFKTRTGIAKSIFGRIMCHAIFHRESGDLRWVGAVPNPKPPSSSGNKI